MYLNKDVLPDKFITIHSGGQPIENGRILANFIQIPLDKRDKLGYGGQGIVYKYEKDGYTYAIKQITRENKSDINYYLTEKDKGIKYDSHLNSCKILNLLEYDDIKKYLVYPYEGIELTNYVKELQKYNIDKMTLFLNHINRHNFLPSQHDIVKPQFHHLNHQYP